MGWGGLVECASGLQCYAPIWRCLTGGGAQIRPHPAVAMALILTVDNDGVEQSQVAVQWALLLHCVYSFRW